MLLKVLEFAALWTSADSTSHSVRNLTNAERAGIQAGRRDCAILRSACEIQRKP